MNKEVRVRFAPSPTGYLHIGGARTALFNYLFARHNNGKFLLRIEDTDRQRSTSQAVEAIFDGLNWLGLNRDEEPLFQFARSDRHAEIAMELVARGKAYKCYHSKEELEVLREEALKSGLPIKSAWRDKQDQDAPPGVAPSIRLKVPEGRSSIRDLVLGTIEHANSDFEDTILLRSDLTPTYMLAVVVDDHDMGITHVIRGDDHLTNSFRQKFIYEALAWDMPEFAHIPLIHGPDGAKLSKRHGALGIDAYKDMGYLPAAMRNYLLRLGWSHGDDEIISDEQAVEWFNLANIGKSPARIDFKKMDSVNAHYIKNSDASFLLSYMEAYLNFNRQIDHRIVDLFKTRAKTMLELKGLLEKFAEYPHSSEEDALSFVSVNTHNIYFNFFANIPHWNKDTLFSEAKLLAESNNISISDLSKYLRCKILGMVNSPSIYEIMEILGKDEVLRRLN